MNRESQAVQEWRVKSPYERDLTIERARIHAAMILRLAGRSEEEIKKLVER